MSVNCGKVGRLVRSLPRVGGALTVMLLLNGLHAQPQIAQFNCASLKPSQSQRPAYGRMADKPQCEGYYEKNVSQPFLELVSLTHAKPGSIQIAEHGLLSMRGSTERDYRLLIQPLQLSPLYRVDALVPKSRDFAWDSRSMLSLNGLGPKDLGFLATVDSAPEMNVLTPVSLGTHEDERFAYAQIRPSVDLSQLHWRIGKGSTGAEMGAWQSIPGQGAYAWSRVPIEISLPAQNETIRVDVQAFDAQGQMLRMLSFAVLRLSYESR